MKFFFQLKHTTREKRPPLPPSSQLTFPRIRGRGVLLAGGGGVMTSGGSSVKVLLEEPQGHPCWLSSDRHHARPRCCLSCSSLTISSRPRSCSRLPATLWTLRFRAKGVSVRSSHHGVLGGAGAGQWGLLLSLSPGKEKPCARLLSVWKPGFILVSHFQALG